MSEIITYPAKIKTMQQRLHAVYSLVEQMRLEHNRVGAIARSDWKRYQGKWIEYARLYAAKQLPLLEEQNRLKEAIQKVECPDWDKLSDRDKEQAYTLMYGDKVAIKVEPTLATSDLLNELKVVSLDKLAGISLIDPTENFTTYTEVDDGVDDITVTASKIDAVNVDMLNTSHYVYKDFTADHFNALNVLVECYIDSATTYQENTYGSGIGFSNTVGKPAQLTSPSVQTAFRKTTTPAYQGFLLRGYFTASDFGTISADTLYYCILARAAASDTVTFALYTDAARTSLHDTYAVAGYGTATRYRYCYGMLVGAGISGSYYTGYTQDMDLQEAAGGWANIAKVSGVAAASISKMNSVLVASIAKVNGVAV